MKTGNKHIICWRIFGFAVLVLSMVALNRYAGKGSNDRGGTPAAEIAIGLNTNGVTPLAIQIPRTSEGALPIKMVSNPYSNFMVLSQTDFDLKINYLYRHFKNKYTNNIYRLQLFYILARESALKNKDIR
ncbi:MAG: hypothetical protein PF436_11615 [Prolixibacteraceae bacterium]|nr:hypothetical protein [Prolixibacteraceae bacterium]